MVRTIQTEERHALAANIDAGGLNAIYDFSGLLVRYDLYTGAFRRQRACPEGPRWGRGHL
ncbi:hypothetical protein RV134_340131 [Roseovarius sp. EC-HK134]|nr:hypothetical protein RV134_340131 [Roseovarius sp. EC-HK134]VVT26492.1 hypothetical protein RV420_400131 [Roseovarius sp. EC-SD190]